ncbi:MAG: adenylyl-sulfate kinase [Dehalococcoidia bacterium]
MSTNTLNEQGYTASDEPVPDATGFGWVVWFVGLPGSGKSTYAGAVFDALRKRGDEVTCLSMDERRKAYFLEPQYTAEEREKAYRLFADEAAMLAREGGNVIMDGTAHRLSMRSYARRLMPKFAEIEIRCPLEVAVQREKNRPEGEVMAGLYEKAIQRKETGAEFEGLGEVVGVDVPFEENPEAECIIDSTTVSIEEGKDMVIALIDRWWNR